MTISKISKKLFLVTLIFSVLSSLGLQLLVAMEQVINHKDDITNICHISHSTILDVLKKRGLDLETMWVFFVKKNKISSKIVAEIIATRIFNFFALLEVRLINEQLDKDLQTKSHKLEYPNSEKAYPSLLEEMGNQIINDFLTKAFNLRVMNVTSELIKRIEQDYGINVIGSDKVLKIECLNKIRTKDGREMFHSAALHNILATQSNILQALGVVIAYHFTHESLLQRKEQEDDTLHDIPLLVIRISQRDPSTPNNNPVNPKTIAQNLRNQEKLPSTKTCTDLESKFYIASDKLFNQLNEQPLCQLFQETELAQPSFLKKLFCKAAVVCVVLLNPLAATVNALIPFPTIPVQNVCFTTTGNIPVCCDLNHDLSLTCCNQDTPTQCITFNLLDDDNPTHNCCKANALGNINCSTDLCLDPNAIVGPCSKGGGLVNKTIDETYGEQHHQLADALDKISKSKNFTDNEITLERSRAKGFTLLTLNSADQTTRQDAIGKLVKYIRYIEKNFKISPDRKVPQIKILNYYDYAATNTSGDLTLFLSSQHNLLPSLDFVLGHEIAHNYQGQILKSIKQQIPDLGSLKPGFEMSADILGSLASNYNNLAAIGAQWLSLKEDINNICTIELQTVNRTNAATIRNLLETTDKSYPHPNTPIRGTILLKLSTMIKAAVKYLEQKSNIPGQS